MRAASEMERFVKSCKSRRMRKVSEEAQGRYGSSTKDPVATRKARMVTRDSTARGATGVFARAMHDPGWLPVSEVSGNAGRADQKYHSSRVGRSSVLDASRCVARKESARVSGGLHSRALCTISSKRLRAG